MLGAGHAAIISMTGFYYPSPIRSTGGGWASFMAKIGSTLASYFGAYFLISRAAVLDSYVLSAAVLLGFALCVFALTPFVRRLKAEGQAQVAPSGARTADAAA